MFKIFINLLSFNSEHLKGISQITSHKTASIMKVKGAP